MKRMRTFAAATAVVLLTGLGSTAPQEKAKHVRAKGETVVQVIAMGPFDVKYANPNDPEEDHEVAMEAGRSPRRGPAPSLLGDAA